MKFEPYVFENQVIGHAHQMHDGIFFFGNAAGTMDTLKSAFPHLHFSLIHQVHGDTLIKSDKAHSLSPQQQQMADAHWTTERHHALVIKTADCIPILIRSGETVCSIHAGWRGILNEIVPKTVHSLFAGNNKNLMTKDILVAFGPHIQGTSFEVDRALGEEFNRYYLQIGASDSALQRHSVDSKAYVDLKKILRQQLVGFKISHEQVFEFFGNTFTDERFASYRRLKDKASRNLSFVARL